MLNPVRTLLLALAAALVALAAAAQDGVRLGDRFDAARLGRDDARFLQAALALAGDYDGLLDGAWGRGSQDALDAWAERLEGRGPADWRAVQRLVRDFDRRREADDWAEVWHRGERIGHLLPQALLRPRRVDGALRYEAIDGGLDVVFQVDAQLPQRIHDAFVVDGIDGRAPYRTRGRDLVVSAGVTAEGARAYVRSDRVEGGWGTHLIVADARRAGEMKLIAASLGRRERPDLQAAPGGVLAGLIAGTNVEGPPTGAREGTSDGIEAVLGTLLGRAIEEALGDRDRERDVAPPPVRGDGGDRFARPAATGFRVNTTDIVTASEIVERCGEVATAGGEALREVAVDPVLGVAVLAGEGRSRDWLSLAPRAAVPGSTVTLVGRQSDGAVLRDGRIEGRGDGRRVRHDLAVGPGAAGAPLVDFDDLVVAVALREGRDDRSALPARALATFLDGVGVPYHDNGPTRADRPARRAVVALACAD